MSKTFEQGKEEVAKLCQYFATSREVFIAPEMKEAQVRQTLIDPLFEALGWDVHNRQQVAPQNMEVIYNPSLDDEGERKEPDYAFRFGRTTMFYAEAKKCAVDIGADPAPACQLRRYGWSAKVALSLLTNFEELGVYDCTLRPHTTDKASRARTQHFRYDEYPDRWREIWDVFSHEAFLCGKFDQYAASKRKRGTSEVDVEFLKEIEGWRDALARNIALRNKDLSSDDLNAAVQRTIDRVVFLRMAEDRGIEAEEQLLKLCEREDIYRRFMRDLCRKADEKYNSGLFHFQKEDGVSEDPDRVTPRLTVDDKVFKPILQSLYFAHGSPYQFGVLPVEILGTVYERFLGKVIRLTAGHQAKIEEKPEVRKAGGVYYTPKHIVDYIVKQTVGRKVEGRSPSQLAGIRGQPPFRVLDMACGSGSFLLGAYQCLLEHCLKWFIDHNPSVNKKAVYRDPRNARQWRLTIEEKKRILTAHVFGVDIDPQAVEVSKLSLLLKALEGENDASLSMQMKLFHDRALPNLADNVKCGNSLIGSDYFTGKLNLDPDEMKRVNAMDWKQAFPDAMKAGGFDCIIGNPPYVRPHNMPPGSKRYFWEKYTTFVAKSDIYCVFLERGATLLRESGRLGFIVSNGWLRLDSFQSLRDFLLRNVAVDRILDFTGDVFEQANVKTCILAFSKNLVHDHEVQIGTTPVTQQLDSVPLRKVNQGVFTTCYKSIFDLSFTEENESVKAKMRGFVKTIEDEFDLSFGLKTGDDARFLSQRKKSSDYKPLLRGEDVHRYSLAFKGEYVWYLPEEMTAHRKTARPGTSERFEQPKILVRDTGGGLQGTLDTDYYYVKDVLVVSHRTKDVRQLAYLLGLLNSRLMRFYYETSFPTLHVQRDELASLPFRHIGPLEGTDGARRDRVVSLVEAMLALYEQLATANSAAQTGLLQRQIAATDAEIDRLVYDLYGLTAEEVATVEGATK
jgi:SAM-dependent methyltransferase